MTGPSRQLHGRAFTPVPFKPVRNDVPEKVTGLPERVVANGREARVVGYRLAVVVEYEEGGREIIPLDAVGQYEPGEVLYHPAGIEERHGGWFTGGRR